MKETGKVYERVVWVDDDHSKIPGYFRWNGSTQRPMFIYHVQQLAVLFCLQVAEVGYYSLWMDSATMAKAKQHVPRMNTSRMKPLQVLQALPNLVSPRYQNVRMHMYIAVLGGKANGVDTINVLQREVYSLSYYRGRDGTVKPTLSSDTFSAWKDYGCPSFYTMTDMLKESLKGIVDRGWLVLSDDRHRHVGNLPSFPCQGVLFTPTVIGTMGSAPAFHGESSRIEFMSGIGVVDNEASLSIARDYPAIDAAYCFFTPEEHGLVCRLSTWTNIPKYTGLLERFVRYQTGDDSFQFNREERGQPEVAAGGVTPVPGTPNPR